jgi:hypothetical protein
LVIRPPFERREMAIAPGESIAPPDDAWTDAIVVVEEGEIELVGRDGATVRIRLGGILWFTDVTRCSLRNPGGIPAVISSVRRIPSRRVHELPEHG